MSAETSHPWVEEFNDFLRGFGSAFLFAIPLLYTLEMWEIGASIEPWKLILYLGAALLVNVLLAYFSGFKDETTLLSNFIQALDAVAVGVIASVCVLLLLNRLTFADPLEEWVGKIVLQTVPLSIGASIANAIFSSQRTRDWGELSPQRLDPWRAILNDMGATATGGLFIGFSIAPTDEVEVLAVELGLWHKLALIAFSLLLTYLIVFEGAFREREARRISHSPFRQPFTETVLAYCVSLGVALLLLFGFDRVGGGDTLERLLSETLVLGLPVAIGGAAGRLLI